MVGILGKGAAPVWGRELIPVRDASATDVMPGKAAGAGEIRASFRTVLYCIISSAPLR